MILLNALDLEKSFQKLKDALLESESLAHSGSHINLMQAYVNLSKQVQHHITECTGLEPIHFQEENKDDLNGIDFN